MEGETAPRPELDEALARAQEDGGINGDPQDRKQEGEGEVDDGQLDGGAEGAVEAEPHCLEGPHQSRSRQQRIPQPNLQVTPSSA